MVLKKQSNHNLTSEQRKTLNDNLNQNKSTKIPRNKREAQFQVKMMQQGWEVYHKGYPDFLCHNPITGEIKAFEIKPLKGKEGTGLSKQQKRMIDLFNKVGIETKVVYLQ